MPETFSFFHQRRLWPPSPPCLPLIPTADTSAVHPVRRGSRHGPALHGEDAGCSPWPGRPRHVNPQRRVNLQPALDASGAHRRPGASVSHSQPGAPHPPRVSGGRRLSRRAWSGGVDASAPPEFGLLIMNFLMISHR
jgi:hypothetical protein